jgi:hypothetical protein
VACSEGGRVEVDGGGVTMTKNLRKRTAAGRFEARIEVAACSGPGMRQWCAPGPRSRMAGGGSGVAVSRATAERERA